MALSRLPDMPLYIRLLCRHGMKMGVHVNDKLGQILAGDCPMLRIKCKMEPILRTFSGWNDRLRS